jgi:hypothetical protein
VISASTPRIKVPLIIYADYATPRTLQKRFTVTVQYQSLGYTKSLDQISTTKSLYIFNSVICDQHHMVMNTNTAFQVYMRLL